MQLGVRGEGLLLGIVPYLSLLEPLSSSILPPVSVCASVCARPIFVCMFSVLRLCGLSASDGQRPGSPSSFGKRGNMGQTGTTGVSDSGPAAHEESADSESLSLKQNSQMILLF